MNLAAGVALFSFIGVECAAIAAGRVKDPRRNVGRASVIGTAASGLLYVAVTAVVMGLVPHDQLVDDGAPFVAAFDAIFDGGWIGKLVALTAVISGLGALNGWTMVTAEMPYAAAKDGPVPAGLRQGEPPRRAVVRHRRLDDRGLGAHGLELQRRDRPERVHLPRVPVGGHRGDPVLPLGVRPAGLPGVAPPPGAGWALARDLAVAASGPSSPCG